MTELPIKAILGNKRIQLNLPSTAVVVSHGRQEPRSDYAAMVREQLNSPVDFPPLMLALIEDDKIAVALEDGVPDGMMIASQVIAFLLEHGTAPENISWVLASTHKLKMEKAYSALSAIGDPPIQIVLHDPDDIESHAYVAASESADAIYVQREIIDADVVLPIYCARTKDCPHASDLFGISPSFTDAATQQRLNTAWIEDNALHLHEHEKLSREAGWLAGIQFAIAVVPSNDGHVAQILAGKPDLVFERATDSLVQDSDDRFDLVVSLVEGDEQQQTWLSAARAASYADSLASDAGRIILCCDVRALTKGIRDLRSDAPIEEANRRLIKSQVEDAFAAAILRTIAAKRSIYFFSSASASDIDSIGFAHIDTVEGIEHLLSQSSSICLIRGAQY